MKTLRLVPVNWRDACEFIGDHHRHHRPPRGYKFGVGVATVERVLVGVATVGRPTARNFQNGQTLEVSRVATDGTANACSMLYGACWTASKALGYTRLVTYTQEGESGASLRAVGWRLVAERPAHGGWDRPSRPRDDKGSAGVQRYLWEAAA